MATAPMPSWAEPAPRTLRDAVSDAWTDASLLMQQHLELAAEEAAERTSGLGVDLGVSLAGTALIHGAVLGLMAAAALGLYAAGLAPWLAVAIVAVAAGVIGTGLALWAKSRLVRRTTARSVTLEALADTSEWIGSALRGEHS